jgi:hypothetical protein
MFEYEREKGKAIAQMPPPEKGKLIARMMFGQHAEQAQMALFMLLGAWGVLTGPPPGADPGGPPPGAPPPGHS